jgi:CMP-N,N'-diacetyllegionaminic acid synthase
LYKKKKILILIPARGGSKGIKLKNLRKINKISLLERTINFAKKLNIADKIIVSTDHKKIKKISLKKNCCIHKRSKYLSGDKISDFQLIKDVLYKNDKKGDYDYIIYLQPTSPIRKVNQILTSLNKVINENLNGSWSVTKIDKKFHPLKILTIKNNYLKSFIKKGQKIIARQQLNDCYIRNGVFYIFKIRSLMISRSIFLKKIFPSITNYKSINIDSISDLIQAKKIISTAGNSY